MSLVLDLVRHGEAMPSDADGDEARVLSPRGRGDIRRLAERLLSAEGVPSRVLVSPLARARETAGILLAPRANAPSPEIVEALASGYEPGEVIEALAALGIREGHVILVSHQPLIGRLAAHLTGEATPFRPGSCARVRIEAAPGRGSGRLVHAIHPGGG